MMHSSMPRPDVEKCMSQSAPWVFNQVDASVTFEIRHDSTMFVFASGSLRQGLQSSEHVDVNHLQETLK